MNIHPNNNFCPITLEIRIEQGTLQIKYHPEHLNQAKATWKRLDSKKVHIDRIEWCFENFVRDKRIEILTNYRDCLQIEIIDNTPFPILFIKANKRKYLDKRINQLKQELNKFPFKQENTHLERYVRWVKEEGADGKTILKEIITSAKNYPAYSNAAANAGTIWKRARFPLYELDLRDGQMTGADFSEANAEECDFEGANLEGVDFTNAILNGAKLINIKGQGINFGRLPDLIHPPGNHVWGMMISHDSRFLVSIGMFSLIKWDLLTGQMLIEEKHNTHKQEYLAPWLSELEACFDKNEDDPLLPQLTLTDVPDEELLVCFSQNDQFLITCSKNQYISLRDFTTFKTIRFFPLIEPSLFHTFDLKVTSDGQFLIAARISNDQLEAVSQIVIWKMDDILQGVVKNWKILSIPGKLEKISLSPHGNQIGTVVWLGEKKQFQIQIWSIPGLELLSDPKDGFENELPNVEFDWNEEFHLIAVKGTFKKWDWKNKTIAVWRSEKNADIECMQFIRNGKILAYVKQQPNPFAPKASQQHMCFFDVPQQKEIFQFPLNEVAGFLPLPTLHFTFSSDGNYLAISKGSTRIIVKELEQLFQLSERSYGGIPLGDLKEFYFIENNQFVLKDSRYQYVLESEFGNVISKQKIKNASQSELNKSSESFTALEQCSDNYECLISREEDSTKENMLEIWTQSPKEKIISIPAYVPNNKESNVIALSHPNFPYRCVALATDHNIILWKLEEGNPLACFKYRVWSFDSSSQLKFLRFAKRAPFLLLATATEICIVNIEQPKDIRKLEWGSLSTLEDWFNVLKLELFDFDIHQNLCAVSFSFSSLVKSGGTVLIWDFLTGKLVKEIEIPFRANGINFSPDGRFLMAWGKDGLRMWRVNQREVNLLWVKPQFLEARDVQYEPSDMSEANKNLLRQFGTTKEPHNGPNSLLLNFLEEQINGDRPIEKENDQKKQLLEKLIRVTNKICMTDTDKDEMLTAFNDHLDLLASKDEVLTQEQLQVKEEILSSIAERRKGESDNLLTSLLTQGDRGDPSTAALFFLLGNICLQRKLISKAKDNFKRALRIYHTTNNFDSHAVERIQCCIILGNIELHLENFDTAEQYFKYAIKCDNETDISHKYLIQCLELTGDKLYLNGEFAKATEKLKEALALSISCDLKHISFIHFRLGKIAQLQGNFEEACKQLEEACNLDPSSGIYFLFGQFHFQQKNFDLAIKMLQHSLLFKDDDEIELSEIDHDILGQTVKDKMKEDFKNPNVNIPAIFLIYFLLIRSYQHRNDLESTERISKYLNELNTIKLADAEYYIKLFKNLV